MSGFLRVKSPFGNQNLNNLAIYFSAEKYLNLQRQMMSCIESCVTWFYKLEFFPLMEKVYPPVCSIVPNSKPKVSDMNTLVDSL